MPARSAIGSAAAIILGVLAGVASTLPASAAPLPLSRMPLDAARYCNRSCPAASRSAIYHFAQDCAAFCTAL